jgi:hypothetical protein
MPKLFCQWLFLSIVGLTILGCRQNAKKNDYPVIYNAWNARYQYNPLTREMQPVADNKTIGRAWSRDEFGRLNSMYFFSGVQGRDEDLLNTHKVKLDRKRERQWESERESRISQIKEQIALRESNGTDESQQVVEAIQEEEDADMDAFIPMSNIEFTLPDASAPSSDIPGLPLDAPAEEAMEEPSPFAPLPALP